MLDFHTHILPGMDDGSHSLAESLAMLRQEAQLGVDTVVLTPHYYPQEGSPRQFLHRRRKAWQHLHEHLEPGMPQLLLGAEVYYFEGICSSEDLMALRVEGASLLLLEMPMSTWTRRMISDILELNHRDDCQVVLAHIERYFPYVSKAALEDLVRAGVLIQSNVSFFAHWRTRHKALSLMNRGMIHILGSDCHSICARRPNWDTLPEKAKPLLASGANLLSRHKNTVILTGDPV